MIGTVILLVVLIVVWAAIKNHIENKDMGKPNKKNKIFPKL